MTATQPRENQSIKKTRQEMQFFNIKCSFFSRISPYLGSGSDHMPFLQRIGIPCIDQWFERNSVKNKNFQKPKRIFCKIFFFSSQIQFIPIYQAIHFIIPLTRHSSLSKSSWTQILKYKTTKQKKRENKSDIFRDIGS